MAKMIRVFDPTETKRRIGLEFNELNCPGLLEFLAHIPYGFESSVIRGIIYRWFVEHKAKGDFDAAVMGILDGPGTALPNKLPSTEELMSLASFATAAPERTRSSKARTHPTQVALSQAQPRPKSPSKQKPARISAIKE